MSNLNAHPTLMSSSAMKDALNVAWTQVVTGGGVKAVG